MTLNNRMKELKQSQCHADLHLREKERPDDVLLNDFALKVNIQSLQLNYLVINILGEIKAKVKGADVL